MVTSLGEMRIFTLALDLIWEKNPPRIREERGFGPSDKGGTTTRMRGSSNYYKTTF